ncbi:MAG TPA: tetratricopeptide repeat protein [Nostocaceae cyanobacterium]|nr:tetratricopeptide repeat protein [Nostocaceae cyanobacterium]
MNIQPTPEQILQSILKNVSVGGNLTTGDITQILNLWVVIEQQDIFTSKEIPQNIPRSDIIKFVGRAEVLVNLHKKLQNTSVIAVQGMGGLGKTELATQYALIHLLLKTYPGGICWLRAGKENINIGTQILQFATTKLGLKLPDNLDAVKQVDYCWSNWRRDGDVLIVLDDVTDYQSVKPYLPPASLKFKLLITSRLQLDSPQSISLNFLDESPALELLQTWVGEKVTQELETAKELCEFLGYLPLALNLVGRYIKKRNISLAKMLRRLEKEKITHQALARNEKDPTWTLNVNSGVIAAFELSWSELSDDAKELAVLLSLFALAPIPWSLVEKVKTVRDVEQLEDSRIELENLHLLQSKENYELHPLIRQFFQLKQNEINETEELKRAFCQTMVEVAKKIPDTITLQQVTDISPQLPHIAEVANNLIEYVSDNDLIWPFWGNVTFYKDQGLYAQALPWCQQCLETTKQSLGEEHPDFATSLNNLAFLYNSQGRYSEAEPLYRQALELRRRVLGEEHPDFATSLNNLALLYSSQGRYSEAEPLYRQALELWRRVLGEEHPDFATSLNNLAGLYDSQGRYSEAEPLYRQALEICEKSLGVNHPHTVTVSENLQICQQALDKLSNQ